MTYSQFIQECENYQYSQEYYDIKKDIAELELMERYVENQRFIAEEADMYQFTNGFLMEAGDTEDVKTKLGEKAKNLLKKIWEGLKKAWGAFINFIKLIPAKVKGLYNELLKAKAVVNLLFVAKTANDDPKGLGRLFKKFGDLIEIPYFYNRWNIFVSDGTLSDAKSLDSEFRVGFNLKAFAKVSSKLADLINGNETDPATAYVYFEFSPDRHSYFKDKAANITFEIIRKAVNSMVDAMAIIKSGSKHALRDSFKEITDIFTEHGHGATEIWVAIGGNYGNEYDILELDKIFHKAIDLLVTKINDDSYQIDSEELKSFNEINRALTWALSEYMIASKHALKLIADIAKFSGKVREEYEKDQNSVE